MIDLKGLLMRLEPIGNDNDVMEVQAKETIYFTSNQSLLGEKNGYKVVGVRDKNITN